MRKLVSPSIEWLGGFFDADGSVSLSRRVRNGSPIYTPIVALFQADQGLMEAVGVMVDSPNKSKRPKTVAAS